MYFSYKTLILHILKQSCIAVGQLINWLEITQFFISVQAEEIRERERGGFNLKSLKIIVSLQIPGIPQRTRYGKRQVIDIIAGIASLAVLLSWTIHQKAAPCTNAAR